MKKYNLQPDEILVSMGPNGEGVLERIVKKSELGKIQTPSQLVAYLARVKPISAEETLVYNGILSELSGQSVSVKERVANPGMPVEYRKLNLADLCRTSDAAKQIFVQGNHVVGYRWS